MHLLFAALLLRHWLLASDLHVEPGAGARAPSAYASDTNWALFDATVAQMRKSDPAAQVVILPGDFLAHHFPSNVPLAERTMARIVRTFDLAFPHAQFVVVPGNNDDPCGDYRATPGSRYFKYIAHLWAPLVNRNGAAPGFESSFADYGWYSAKLPSGLRAFALDTVYWSILYRSCAKYHPDAPQRQMRWLAASLGALPPKTRAIVVTHIPPGVDPRSTMLTRRLLIVPYWRDDISQRFAGVLSEHASSIAFAISGHTHRDDFRLVGNVAMMLAPSVSPVYNNNPAFLRLDVTSNGTLENYRVVYYDEWSGAWKTEQSFDEEWNVRAFSPSALASIHENLRTDPDLRRQWARIYVMGSSDQDIDYSTWRMYWCAQTELAGGYVPCTGLQRRLELLPIAAAAAGAVILACLAFLAVRLGRRRRRL